MIWGRVGQGGAGVSYASTHCTVRQHLEPHSASWVDAYMGVGVGGCMGVGVGGCMGVGVGGCLGYCGDSLLWGPMKGR